MTLSQRRQLEHRRVARAFASDMVRARTPEPKPERINWLLLALVLVACCAAAVALDIHSIIGGL